MIRAGFANLLSFSKFGTNIRLSRNAVFSKAEVEVR